MSAPGSLVVILEEDAALRRALVRRLVAEGYEVAEADAPAGLRRITEGAAMPPDAVLVGADAETALEMVGILTGRGDAVALVAMLGPTSTQEEGCVALDHGADDFLVKPFSPRELVARLGAVLRRTRGDRVPLTPMTFGTLTIDPARREVMVDRVSVPLTAREFDLLTFLARNPGRVFTRRQLLDQVWGPDVVLGEATVTEHVRRVRRRIESDPRHPVRLETIWSVGYRFNS